MLRSQLLRTFVLVAFFGGFAVNAYASMLHHSMMAAAPAQAAHSVDLAGVDHLDGHHANASMEEGPGETGHHNQGGASDAACCHAAVCPVGAAAIPPTSLVTPLRPIFAAQLSSSADLAAGLQHTPLLRPPR